MSEMKHTPQEILPSVPCSRNLRRRTGVWLGLQAWEIVAALCMSMIPDFLHRVGFTENPNLFLGVLLSAVTLGFFILFHRNKPPNYFSLWLHHHWLHPDGWRAPRSGERVSPIASDAPSIPGSSGNLLEI